MRESGQQKPFNLTIQVEVNDKSGIGDIKYSEEIWNNNFLIWNNESRIMVSPCFNYTGLVVTNSEILFFQNEEEEEEEEEKYVYWWNNQQHAQCKQNIITTWTNIRPSVGERVETPTLRQLERDSYNL